MRPQEPNGLKEARSGKASQRGSCLVSYKRWGGPRGRVRGSQKRLRPVRPGFLLTECSVFILCFLFPKELCCKFYSLCVYLKFFKLCFIDYISKVYMTLWKYKYIIHVCLYSLHIYFVSYIIIILYMKLCNWRFF